MIGKSPSATEHTKRLHIHPAFLQHPCPTCPFTKQEQQIVSPGAVCFHWGFLLLVKPQPTALRGSLQCCGYPPRSHLWTEQCLSSLRARTCTQSSLACSHPGCRRCSYTLAPGDVHIAPVSRGKESLSERLKDALGLHTHCTHLQRATPVTLYPEG